MSRHVAVLMGGWSAERAVSLASGAEVAKALAECGHRVTMIDVRRDLSSLLAALTPKPDVVFNALHGRGGEDGCVQAVLEFLGVPYSHSGVLASAVAMDKPMTKQVLAAVGVPSPRGVVLRREEVGTCHPLPPPYIVKPVDEGSTVGVTLVEVGDSPFLNADQWTFGERVMVEAFIPGRELTVGVMDDRALAVTEIRFSGGLFDFTAKYTAGHAHHVIPAPLPVEVYSEAQRLAVLAHRTLGCRGVSRSDFRYDDSRPGVEGLFFLEINTQPGMTPLSLVPEQAAHVGVSYHELVNWIVEHAVCPA
ncbi:D-alanine--D-alanine ligase [Azospirillaceae bacterium]